MLRSTVGPDADSHRHARRRSFSSGKSRALIARSAFALIVLAGFVVQLQSARAETGFDLTLVRPSTSGSAYVHQESVTLAPARTWTLSAFMDGVLDPLVLREPISDAREGGLVEKRLETTVGLAYVPHQRVSLALSLAAVPWQTGSGGNVPLAWAAATPRRTAFGDASLFAKVGLWGTGDEAGWRLSFSTQLFLPTGQATSYAGAGGVTGLFRLWGGYVTGRGSVTVGGGYDLVPRADVPLVGILVDDRWTLAIAGAWRLTSVVTVLGEAQASVLAETARRLYPRGVAAALGQAPAYALVGTRLDVLPKGDLLVAAWTGMGAQPGAAKLGLMVGWSGTWDTDTLWSKPLAEAKPSGPVVATAIEQPTDNTSPRETTPDDTAGPDENPTPEAPTEDQKPTRATGSPKRPPTTARHGEALASLDGDEITLAAPLPFKGRTAKLAAGSVPTLKAIAKLLKAQKADTRLAVRLEAVGTSKRDLALAKKRAVALRGVFAHLAQCAPSRITAEGTPSSGAPTDVETPALRLVLSSPSRARSEATPGKDEPAGDTKHAEPASEIEPENQSTPKAAETAAKPAADARASDAHASDERDSGPAPAGPLAKRVGNAIVLARPLPFQGRTAKLDAASIPSLKAIAQLLKRERGKKVLLLAVEAVGDESSARELATARAEALRDVFAHLAHWPTKRVLARSVRSRGTTSDPALPPLSLELAPPGTRAARDEDDTSRPTGNGSDDDGPETNEAPAREVRPTAVAEDLPTEASPKKTPGGALAHLEAHRIVLASPLPFDGDGPKLTAAAIPLVKAIAKLLKAQPPEVALTVRVEAVGASTDDLELAQSRARALEKVFAQVAHWPARRIIAVGVGPTSGGDDVASPPVTLELGPGGGHAKRPRSSRK